MSIKYVSENGGISVRRIQVLCSKGGISGAVKLVYIRQFLKMRISIQIRESK